MCDDSISNMNLYLLTLGFFVLGVLFGVYLEGMTFLVAINFAVGLLTTTGSQTCKNAAINNVITGTYMLFGIPLYAFTLGRVLKSLPQATYEGVRDDL